MRPEKEIIEELRKGTATAFDNLYKAYSQKLYSFAFTFLKSREDAQEVVQDTYSKIWEKRKSIDSNQSFKSFLFSIGYHSTIDLLRHRLKEAKYREQLLVKASSNYNLEQAIEFGDLLEHVNHLIEELPPRKLEIYKLSRIEHLSYSEIAEKLNISVKTVENGINFSMNFIRGHLGKDTLAVMLYASLFL
ncbi:MAG: RNA polymerase sigma-70 factor [Mariniphaga sp.]